MCSRHGQRSRNRTEGSRAGCSPIGFSEVMDCFISPEDLYMVKDTSIEGASIKNKAVLWSLSGIP